jgi:hypothetical protein
MSVAGQMKNNRATQQNAIAESKGRIENMRQDSEEAILRNKILNEYVGRQQGYVGQNQGTLAGVTGQFAAPAQETALTGAQDRRGAVVADAINATPQAEVATHASASPMVQGEIAKRMMAAMDQSRAKGAAGAKVAGYGDVWGVNNGEALQNSARTLDTNNNFARGDISTLGADQDLQAFQQRRPVFVKTVNPNPGATMQGLGSLVGSLAGAYGRQVPNAVTQAARWFGS